MKSYKVKMLSSARNDLAEIIEYLSDFSGDVALNQYDMIIDKINSLKTFPFKYEEYRSNSSYFKYRRLVVNNYLVFYVVLDDTVEIHRIVHAKIDLSKILE